MSLIISWSFHRLMSIELMMPSNHLILCHPLLLLPSIFLSIRVFFNESTLCLRGPKYWSFSTSPSNEYSVLIFFRIDWLDLSAVQGTLKSLFQHHSLVQFSRSIISDSLQPHELQHARLLCPSPSLLKFMSIDLVMPFNHLILCHPLLLLPSIFPSITVFSNELALHIRWHFSFNISPSNEYSGLISFRIDWLDLLAVQETLKILLQHHS